MSKMNPIISNILTAVVTATILGVGAWAGGVFSAGSDALSKDQIEAVIKQVMITDTGETYAATLIEINLHMASIDASIGHIEKDITRIDGAVGALAAK